MSQANPPLLQVARLHFVYVVILAAQIVIYDSWKLITPQAVLERWIAVALLLVVNTVVWYIAKAAVGKAQVYKILTMVLILADIALAAFYVYHQRGMASRAVMLFTIPIAVSATLLSRSALLATAALSSAAYVTAAISYFVINFNEGYKIELYGEVGFYCLGFFLLASILGLVVSKK